MTDNYKWWTQHRSIVELIDKTVTVESPDLLRTILYHLECVAENEEM